MPGEISRSNPGPVSVPAELLTYIKQWHQFGVEFLRHKPIAEDSLAALAFDTEALIAILEKSASSSLLAVPETTEGICQDCGREYGVWFAPPNPRTSREKQSPIDLAWERSGLIGKLWLIAYVLHCRFRRIDPNTGAHLDPSEDKEVSAETMARMSRLFRGGDL